MTKRSPFAIRRGFGAALALTMLVGGLIVPAIAVAEESGDLEMMVKGRVTYRIYCTSCHGPTGRGDGNLAQYMNVQPADLTALAAGAEGGVFPAEELHAIIDGRSPGVRGHGAKEMPVWGDVFKSLDVVGENEEMVSQKIAELVVFLKSIQGEAGSGG